MLRATARWDPDLSAPYYKVVTGPNVPYAAVTPYLHPAGPDAPIVMRQLSMSRIPWAAIWPRWKERLSEPSPTAKLNPAIQSQYVDILLEMEQIPLVYNMAASICTWLVLAGFLIFPGTFTTLRESSFIEDTAGGVIYRAVQHIPLLSIAAILYARPDPLYYGAPQHHFKCLYRSPWDMVGHGDRNRFGVWRLYRGGSSSLRYLSLHVTAEDQSRSSIC
ncbi:hypothetical protein FE257_004932 [Aspergillus nanangensis]|uniref:Uncharacterized protein n=1 Tax=Aspergillus nanangensis TaxID=2582783 RepID=A0AAD4CAI8_ASPNN|nr:hypothetical protein FE257_004932 [Aspergillus nanangensis]